MLMNSVATVVICASRSTLYATTRKIALISLMKRVASTSSVTPCNSNAPMIVVLKQVISVMALMIVKMAKMVDQVVTSLGAKVVFYEGKRACLLAN